MRPLAVAASSFLLLLLAGCSSSPPVEEAPVVSPPPAAPTGYAYECPPGETSQEGDLCVGRIASLTESNQEPFLAIHPTDPLTMAVGVNAGHSTGAVQLGEEGPPRAETIRYDIFFTTDGGGTWKHTTLPYTPGPGSVVPVEDGGAGDPAMAFDEAGVLHVSVLRTRSLYASGGWGILYMSSADLGESWSEPVLFTDDTDNDRNWLTRTADGQLFVPWQNVGDSSQVAWSLDDGATWQVQTATQMADECITVSPVVVADLPLVACAGYEDSTLSGLRVYTLDTATGDLSLRADLDDMECVWPQLRQVGDLLVLSGESCGEGELMAVSSSDGGWTWSEPFSLTAATQAAVTGYYWSEPDPWGRLHFIAGAFGNAGGAVVSPVSITIHHVAVDPTTWTVVHEQMLRAVEGQPRLPDAFPMDYGDHYYGMAFHDSGGFLVWTRDRGLEYTALVPTGLP